MFVFRPYPDEIIGSFVARLCRHLGIKYEQLFGLASPAGSSRMPFYMPIHLGRLAAFTGLPSAHLIQHHSLVPFAVAFTDEQWAKSYLHHQVALDALRQAAMPHIPRKSTRHSVASARYCHLCAEAERQQYGQAYWHRTHQIPTVWVCVRHGISLSIAPTLSPHLLLKNAISPGDGHRSSIRVPWATAMSTYALANATMQTLETDWAHRADWQQQFRALAARTGYGDPDDAWTGARVCHDITQYFGPELLQTLACDVAIGRNREWPIRILTGKTTAGPSTVTHLLMKVFFEHAVSDLSAHAESASNISAPAPLTRDQILADAVLTLWKLAVQLKQRTTAHAMLNQIWLGSMYRRCSNDFPLTKAVLADFSTSPECTPPRQRRPT